MSVTTGSIADKVLAAELPLDLFPADEDEARKIFKRFARVLHPDVAGEGSAEAFRRLSYLYEWHRTGDRPKGANQIILTTKHRTYVLGDLLYEGDVANLYRGTYDDGGNPAIALLKMSRDPNDNDLLIAEATALKVIRDEVDPKWQPFFPSLIESFRHQDNATKVRRRINAIERLDGFYSLAEVLEAYPDGLHPKDVAWMWRRVLVALDVAHHAGLVHGAPTPENILIHPEKHGLVLIDWCYSVKKGEPLKVIPEKHRPMYPELDITDHVAVSGALDIFVAHGVIKGLLDMRKTPRQLRVFLTGVMQPRPKTRPTAGETLDAFNDLLLRLYGPRRFRPFEMPAV